MFENLIKPFTSPDTIGVAVRYTLLVIMPLLTAFGFLSEEQVASIQAYFGQPEVVGGIAAFVGIVVYVYGILTKARTAKSDKVAKEVDKEIPSEQSVTIKTPADQNDIVVTAEGKVFK